MTFFLVWKERNLGMNSRAQGSMLVQVDREAGIHTPMMLSSSWLRLFVVSSR